MPRHVTQSQARRFLLKKQLLLSPRSLHRGNAIEEVFQTLRLIQYDPLNPCGRNVDLVLQARIKDYHPDDYYHWLYAQKKGIECYDKELCIVLLEDFPLTNIRRDRAREREDQKTFLKMHERQIEMLLQQIEKHGPVSSADIKDEMRVVSNWGTDAKFGRVALEILWKMGRLVIVNREHGKKYYDLPHNVHTSLLDDSPNKSLTTEHVKRRLKSVGLLPLSGGGGGWQGLGPVRKIISELVSEGEFVEVKIENCPRAYVIAKVDEKLMQEDADKQSEKKVCFIAPLDNLLWDRQMILELFNFYYRWEVYTPITKRVYGYYVLPILYGDEFIGRIEPVLKDGKLEIKGFWQENGETWNKEVWRAFEASLETFKTYLSVKEINNSPLRKYSV